MTPVPILKDLLVKVKLLAPTFDIYETANSIYMVDRALNRYMRAPVEGRTRDWSERLNQLMARNNNMRDDEWVQLDDRPEPIEVIPSPYPIEHGKEILVIHCPGSVNGIRTSPVIRKTLACTSST